jgi:DNA-binding beta-propeller fold protein YncE
MSGLGSVRFTGTVTGIDSLTESPLVQSVTADTIRGLAGDLQAWLTASVAPARLGDLVDLTLSVSNTGGCDVTGVTGALTFTSGAAAMVLMAGPTPPGPVAVAPGALQTFVWTYSAAGIGDIAVTGDAKGTDSGLMVAVSASCATEFNSSGGISTIAGPSGLLYPAGVAVDGAGNVYVAEYGGHLVAKVDAATGTVSTVAGTGTPGYNGDGVAAACQLCSPAGVAIGPDGNLYIADECNNLVRKVDLSAGPPTMTTVAGVYGMGGYNGDAKAPTAAWLYMPRGVAFDISGNIYIADTFNNRVREFSIYGGNIVTVAGGGGSGPNNDPQSATGASLNRPHGVTYDPGTGSMLVTDTQNNRVRRISAGVISLVAGTGAQNYGGDGSPAVLADLNYPYGIDVDAAGNVYFSDWNNHRVRRVDPGGTITTVAGTGTAGYNMDGVPGAMAKLYYPWGIAIDAAGVVYIGDEYNNRVRKLYP